ncbi:MAG: DUF4340 domain-containing protein [Pirellulaceae bacterium]
MNEWTKTGVFGGLALVVVMIAVISRPRIENMALHEMEGKLLFADKFDEENRDNAARLEIVTFDENYGELRRFSVGKHKETGQWSIDPDQYPADNQQQLVEALTSLTGLKVIGVHSEVQKDQEACQVVEPDIDELSTVSSGVGTLVTVRDKTNSAMVSLVIGKKISEEENKRYVRLPDNNVIYVVEVDTSSLSTDFKDWIETDLLDLASLDIRSILLKDYALIPTSQGRLQMQMKSDINLGWNTEESAWALESMIQYKENEPSEMALLDDEELNSQTLNDLKFALDDLEIESVKKKPEGLGADLGVDSSLASNVEGLRSLQELGFFPVQNQQGDGIELLSANGEMHVSLQTGVKYVIRFGEIVADISAEAEDIQRYMVVTAMLDESMLVPPTLEPETPPEPETPAEPEAEPPADPAAEEKDEAADPAAEDSEACQDTPSQPDAGDDKSAAEEQPAEPAGDEEDAARKLEFERKMNEYQDKRKDAIKRVQVLNERFANWYYQISEETYNKIHLGVSDIIKSKEDADGGLDEFRELENKGLELPLLPGLPGGSVPLPPPPM